MGNCEKISRRVLIFPSDCEVSCILPDHFDTDEEHFSGALIPIRSIDTFQRVVPLLFCTAEKDVINKTLASSSLNITREFFAPPEGEYSVETVFLLGSVKNRVLKFRLFPERDPEKELERFAGLVQQNSPSYIFLYAVNSEGLSHDIKYIEGRVRVLFSNRKIMVPWELIPLKRTTVMVDNECFENEEVIIPRDNFHIEEHDLGSFGYTYQVYALLDDGTWKEAGGGEGVAGDLDQMVQTMRRDVLDAAFFSSKVYLEVNVRGVSHSFAGEFLKENLKLFGVDSFEIKVIKK